MAGASLRRTKLPGHSDPAPLLTAANEAVRSTRALHISLLLACVYGAITVLGMSDSALITGGGTAALPLLSASVPTRPFIFLAPIIILLLHMHFQFSVVRACEQLGRMPAILVTGQTAVDQITAWFLTPFYLEHLPGLRSRTVWSRLEYLTGTLTTWWLAPATCGAIWIGYLRRHDWTGTGTHMAVLTLAVLVSLRSRSMATTMLRNPVVMGEGTPGPSGMSTASWLAGGAILVGCALLTIGVFYGRPAGRHLSDDARPKMLATAGARVLDALGVSGYLNASSARLSIAPPNVPSTAIDFRVAPGIDLRGENLRYAQLSDTFLVGADLSGADLTGAVLAGADLRGSLFQGTRLDGVVLYRTRLDGSYFSRVSAVGADLSNASCVGCTLSGVDLGKATASGANFERSKLYGCRLDKAFCSGINFDSATLAGLSARDALLAGARFRRAHIQDAVFRDASLWRANLDRATVIAVDFTGADLSHATLSRLRHWRWRGNTLAVANIFGVVKPPKDFVWWSTTLKGAVELRDEDDFYSIKQDYYNNPGRLRWSAGGFRTDIERRGPDWRPGPPLRLDLAAYCKAKGKQTARNVDGDVEGWRCIPGDTPIDWFEACAEQHGVDAKPVLQRANDPNSWTCGR